MRGCTEEGGGCGEALRESEKCHNHYRSKAWCGHQPFSVCGRKKKHTAAGLWLYILGDGNEEDKLFMEDDDTEGSIFN